MRTDTPMLQVQNLTKRFKRGGNGTDALRGVSLSLFPGEILGIVGESGSGKSTLLRSIARLEKETSGSVILDGGDLKNYKPGDICKSMQMVFQDAEASFDPRMRINASIDENIRNLCALRGADVGNKRRELIEMVGLDPTLGERYPAHLSGGQCQRLAIARALASKPKILLCDEVTSALDVSAQAQIVALLASLRQSLGLSIIFVSHDLALVGSVCDRIVVMHDGEIQEEGPAQQVLDAPEHEYTKALLASVLTIKEQHDI